MRRSKLVFSANFFIQTLLICFLFTGEGRVQPWWKVLHIDLSLTEDPKPQNTKKSIDNRSFSTKQAIKVVAICKFYCWTHRQTGCVQQSAMVMTKTSCFVIWSIKGVQIFHFCGEKPANRSVYVKLSILAKQEEVNAINDTAKFSLL